MVETKEIKKEISNIPDSILDTLKKISAAGYDAYLIGGCVRDLLLHKKPKDWDITTNAKPEEIVKLFPETFYENDYGTVGVVNKEVSDETLKVVEITPYRLEANYSDKRRPDSVIFSQKIEDDLKRRDFTINAIALDPDKGQIVDLYGGQKDIKDKVIRAVGNADLRFKEDALRVLRAIRLSCELDFTIDPETEKALQENLSLLEHISNERIRDEFTRIIMSDHPMQGLELCRKFGILRYIAPDLEKGIGVDQGGIHTFDVWEHLVRSVQHTADKKWPLEIRLAALFHDIGKPDTRSKAPVQRNLSRTVTNKTAPKEKWSFYGHEVVGARLTKNILTELKFSTKTIERVVKLVRWHMFFSDTETITHSAVRRLVANVGADNVWDLMSIRAADRIGTGRPKENPYRLRKYHAMIEEVMRDPVSVGMLKIDGKRLMEVTKTEPGPKIGLTLHALLEEVLENPALNKADYLEKRAGELIQLPEKDLKKLGEKGKESKERLDEENIQEIRKRHFVE